MISTCGHLTNMLSDAKMVLFCGSVCGQSKYLRDEITKHFGVKAMVNALVRRNDLNVYKSIQCISVKNVIMHLSMNCKLIQI